MSLICALQQQGGTNIRGFDQVRSNCKRDVRDCRAELYDCRAELYVEAGRGREYLNLGDAEHEYMKNQNKDSDQS